MADLLDVAIIGTGPVGIACAVECLRRDLRVLAIDAGSLCDTLRRYPAHMRFFSTARQLEIAGHPFPSVEPKPSKDQALAYYRGVALEEGVPLRLYERVTGVTGDRGRFTVATERDRIAARRVIVATGFFQHPVPLGCPGEDLPKVDHYFSDGHAYAAQDLLVVGGANSAVIAALESWRMGARVTVIHRGEDFYPGVKYWLLPDIRNRIKDGEIAAHFDTTLRTIEPDRVLLTTAGRDWELANDFVLAMTGYRSDYPWLRALGVELGVDHQPRIEEHYQAVGRPGLHLAGCVLCGDRTGSIFIENSRHHAREIAEHLAGELRRA